MAISGRIAQASRLGFEDIRRRKAEEEAIAREEGQRGFENRLRLRRIESEEGDAEDLRTRRDQDRSDRLNIQGLTLMDRDRESWEGEQATRRLAEGIAAAEADPSMPPALKKIIGLRKIGISASPSEEMLLSPEEREAEDTRGLRRIEQEADIRGRVGARYREPRTPTEPAKQWVTGPDGAPVFRAPQPGDTPHDPVAARQGGKSDEPSVYALEQSSQVIEKVQDLLPRISATTAGPIGQVLSRIGGTTAADVSAELTSLGSNLAFQQLQAMRDASKTGGALGQVSDKETELLMSVLGSLRQNQSPGNLRRQLQKIQESAQRFVAAAAAQAGSGPAGAPVGMPAFRFNPQTGKLEPVQ